MGWLRLIYAVPLAFLLIVSLRSFVIESSEEEIPASRPLFDQWLLIGFLILLAGLWTFASGAGGFVAQEFDWIKHNALLKDLTIKPWPVVYELSDIEKRTLIYYVAYYLPAAAIGKWIGWEAANMTMFVWTLIGVFLGMLWFLKFVGRKKYSAALLFITIGSLDVIGQFILWKTVPGWADDTSHWTGLWITPSHSSDLFWSPQHALVGWVAAGLLVHEPFFRRTSKYLFLLLLLSTLWSPLVAVGLLPIVLCGLYETKGNEIVSFHNGCTGLLLAAMIGLYFNSHTFEIEHGWLWTVLDMNETWIQLVVFWACEFGLWTFLLTYTNLRLDHSYKWLWWSVVGGLILSPLYYFGFSWDLTMRASIPLLFLFRAFIVRSLLTPHKSFRYGLLVTITLIGLFPGVSQLLRAFPAFQKRGVAPVFEFTPSITHLPETDRIPQYLGSPQSFFFQWLAKPTTKP